MLYDALSVPIPRLSYKPSGSNTTVPQICQAGAGTGLYIRSAVHYAHRDPPSHLFSFFHHSFPTSRLLCRVLCPHLHLKFLPPHLIHTTRTSPRLAPSHYSMPLPIPTPMSRTQRNTPRSSLQLQGTRRRLLHLISPRYTSTSVERRGILKRYQPTSIAEMNAGCRSLAEFLRRDGP